MFYFKKIIAYFDYYESGEKRKSCGHVKILVKDAETTIEIQLRGLGIQESRMCDIYALGDGERKIGRLFLDKGTGYYNTAFCSTSIDGARMQVFDMTGLKILIGENKTCETNWEWGLQRPKLPEAKPEKTPLEAMTESKRKEKSDAKLPARQSGAGNTVQPVGAENEAVSRGVTAVKPESIMPEEPERIVPDESEGIMSAGAEGAGRAKPEDIAPAETLEKESEKKVPEKDKGVQSEQDESAEEALHKSQIREKRGLGREEAQQGDILHEDKWQQLCALYPVCHPFESGEDYISIEPRDFVVLRKEYQNLVSNSFLLHSFYNYHHLLLGKTQDAAEEIFYIGVPGVYLEREKRVAVMFGFEGFAQSMTKSGGTPERGGRRMVEPGAFGYYMKKVEI